MSFNISIDNLQFSKIFIKTVIFNINKTENNLNLVKKLSRQIQNTIFLDATKISCCFLRQRYINREDDVVNISSVEYPLVKTMWIGRDT